MAWEGSTRRARLPDDWEERRQYVLKRDGYRCTFKYPNTGRCHETTGLEVDHVERGDDHSYANLRTLCHRHHKRKSSQEGGQAHQAMIDAKKLKFRRTEAHPGLIPGRQSVRADSSPAPPATPQH